MNAINLIAPYKYLDMWVFDDARVGLLQEPFVDGADTLIDRATAGLTRPEDGFVMLFSATEFPAAQFHLDWARAERGGNVYHCVELDAQGWLCPALFRYFDAAPAKLFVAVRNKPPSTAA